MKNSDMSAMPTHEVFEDCGFDGNSGPHLTQTTNYGMTKREMMAMHICAGISGGIDSEDCYKRIKIKARRCGVNVSQWIARDAVKQADALLAELERTK